MRLWSLDILLLWSERTDSLLSCGRYVKSAILFSCSNKVFSLVSLRIVLVTAVRLLFLRLRVVSVSDVMFKPLSGMKEMEPPSTLSSVRRAKGWIHVGHVVKPTVSRSSVSIVAPSRVMASSFHTRISVLEILKLLREFSRKIAFGISVNFAKEKSNFCSVFKHSSKAASSIVSIGLFCNDISVKSGSKLPAGIIRIALSCQKQIKKHQQVIFLLLQNIQYVGHNYFMYIKSSPKVKLCCLLIIILQKLWAVLVIINCK